MGYRIVTHWVLAGSFALALWMIDDENSEAGKKQFAMLLTAWASGLEVKIVGWNSCLRWSDGEYINYIHTL